MTSADHAVLAPAGPEPEAPLPGPSDRLAPEPATPRALWPTFMRRTLAEDVLQPARRPLPRRPVVPEA